MLNKRLVLFDWAIRQLGAGSFTELQGVLNRPDFEGFTPEGTTHYLPEIEHLLFDGPEEKASLIGRREVLGEMDANIVRHWRQIAERRTRHGNQIFPTYFQYLSLLFTELYLRSYIIDRSGLLGSLNEGLVRFNGRLRNEDPVPPFEAGELNQLAFWSATGSGKTLIMHANLLQFRYYAERSPKSAPEIDSVLLITPNERLSEQHIDELALSGIPAVSFSSSRGQYGMFHGLQEAVQVIEISKLAEETKEKLVAVSEFETNNLVFVDEGHKGTGSSSDDPDQRVWVSRRSALSRTGFVFEYSATFGQALAHGSALENQYAKSILFEYSYPRFYRDGYGKEYRIMNLRQETFEEQKRSYLYANIVYFYQQLRVYLRNRTELAPFLIHRPLLAFVGSSVVRSSQNDLSDVATVVKTLRDFIANEDGSTVEVISQILSESLQLFDIEMKPVFAGEFAFLRTATGVTPDAPAVPVAPKAAAVQLFEEIRRDLFHGSVGKLQVERLTGSKETDGELLLRLGAAEVPFGVITVGDSAKLKKHLEDDDVCSVTDRAISDSYFSVINADDSPIQILVGAKKFIEGWSSWRVSSIGLMRIGESQGPQIIQLFGRGVRLQGYEFRLKRSSRLEQNHQPDVIPNFIGYVETLSVFGVRAGYIETFKAIIEEEQAVVEYEEVPILRVKAHREHYPDLRYIDIDPAARAKTDLPVWLLSAPSEDVAERLRVQVVWSTALQAYFSHRVTAVAPQTNLASVQFADQHRPFLDVDAIHADLVEHKNERRYFNLTIARSAVSDLLVRSDWYELQAPPDTMAFDHAGRIDEWQEIAKALLRSYVTRFYEYHRAAYENDYLRYRPLNEGDGGLAFETVSAFLPKRPGTDDVDDHALLQAIESIKRMTESTPPPTGSRLEAGIQSVFFDRHLYLPLLSINRQDTAHFTPTGLNDGELRFILDLQSYLTDHPEPVRGHAVYVFRNESRGRGLGFFVADNFYPDFMIWLVSDNSQKIVFVDPKGIRNLGGFGHPKLRFFKTIKDLESRLADGVASDGTDRQDDRHGQSVQLHSFIVSTTAWEKIMWNTHSENRRSKEEFESRNVLFMDDGNYLQKLFGSIDTSQ